MPTWLLGVLGGFVASAAFLLVLSLLRPRLLISPQISKLKTDNGDPPYRYRVKIVNKSRRSCVDFTVRAYIATEIVIPKENDGQHGKNTVLKSLDIRRDGSTYIHGYRKNDQDGKYAVKIRFDESSVQEIKGAGSQKHIVLRVYARDGFSDFPKIYEQRYKLSSQICEGTFAFGRSVKIVNWE